MSELDLSIEWCPLWGLDDTFVNTGCGMQGKAITYLATLLTFLALDVAWLLLVAVGQFQRQLGAILEPQPNLAAAAALYIIFAAGLVVLAVRPALRHGSVGTAAAHGAMLGLTAYATFDLTSLAIIKGWTVGLALLDMAWGTLLSTVSALVGYAVGARAEGARANQRRERPP